MLAPSMDQRILVVDDDPDLVDVAAEMIGRRHEVVGTTSTVRALELITTGGIWLLVTDIRMPGVNGFQLIEQARSIAPRLAVVIVSAYYDEAEPLARDVCGRYADQALSKPLTMQALTRAIETLLVRPPRPQAVH